MNATLDVLEAVARRWVDQRLEVRPGVGAEDIDAFERLKGVRLPATVSDPRPA